MRILVVEDEHKIANSVKKALEHENYAVDVAYDGNEGMDLATTETYDAIVLDWMLPYHDGVEICKALRKQNIHTPVLMLTARGQLEDKIEGLDTGADDYMVKPFALSELFARIRALLRRPPNMTDNTLQIADLSLNTNTFEVKRNNVNIRLSSKEFALLEYLMRHPNTIITKDQIIQHVWDYNADVLPNSVEVYIKHLRDKIDSPFKTSPLIHTIRGFGYKLSQEKA
jgi:two-component system, OmpR family, response regulator